MKLYKIRNWDSLFENNRSRELKSLNWTVLPNSHDGATYSQLIIQPDGPEMFAAWVLIVQVASKCDPRGTLLRDDRTPMTPMILGLKTRAPVAIFEKCLKWLEFNSDWLEVSDVEVVNQRVTLTPATIPHPPATIPHDVTKKGREGKGMEQKGREEKLSSSAKSLLSLLNLLTGSSFREVDTNLDLIEARLSEPGITEDGVAEMINRQVALWTGNPDMDHCLRPATLFRKSNFESYYAAKNKPIPTKLNANTRNAAMGISDEQAKARGRKTEEIIRRKMEREALEAKNGSLFKT